ncbi:hypothetical protein C8T65DRAFT_739753 [Cerioporus squamosus]|nr:hypothetical protein C8T65DRAFT_739753 [Cerioporus squamosus]
MTTPAEQDLPIPSIVITPVLPSRDSLPADMRVALDSILGSGPRSGSSADDLHDTEDSVAWSEAGATCGSSDSADTEVPHAPPITQSVPADTHYRVDLDLECQRFSVGEVLSALHASFRSTAGSDATVEDSLVVDGTHSAPIANPVSSCGSGFLVVTDEIPPDDVADGVSTGSLRRMPPPAGECPPTWRHAMYVSSLVWPVKGIAAALRNATSLCLR